MGQGGNTTSARAHFVSLLSWCTHLRRIGVWTEKEKCRTTVYQPEVVHRIRGKTSPSARRYTGEVVDKAYLNSVCHGGIRLMAKCVGA